MDTRQLQLLEIANLELDAKLGKDRHFIAARRKDRSRLAIGLVSLFGSALIASKVTQQLTSVFPDFTYLEGWGLALVALLVSVCTAVLGFLGLEKQVTQHRMVGNMYIEVARKARRMLNRCIESADNPSFEKDFSDLLAQYMAVNREGESCPTDNADSDEAMRMNAASRARIKGLIRQSDEEALGVVQSPTTYSLTTFVARTLKLTLAKALLRTGLLSSKQYHQYVTHYDAGLTP